MKTIFNTQNGVELNETSPVIKNSKNDLRKEQMAKKLTIMTLILLGNVAWVSPSYGMDGEHEAEARRRGGTLQQNTQTRQENNPIRADESEDQRTARLLLESQQRGEQEEYIEFCTRTAQTLDDSQREQQRLSNQVNETSQQLGESRELGRGWQENLRQSGTVNQNLVEQQSILTTRIQVLNINQENCQADLQEYNKILIDQNSTHTAERNQWVEEREAFQAQNNNITAQLDTKNREIEECRTAVQMCETKNNGIDLIRDLAGSKKLIACYEENKNISAQQNEQAIELEKCNVEHHKLENELRRWNDTGRFLQEKTSLFGSSILWGGLYTIPPKILKDLHYPRAAAAAQTIVPWISAGVSCYTTGSYTPLITTGGPAVVGTLSNLASRHLFPKDSNAPTIIGSMMSLTTKVLVQGWNAPETMSNIAIDGILSIGGGFLGSSKVVQLFDYLKVADTLKSCGTALKSRFSSVTADVNNPDNNTGSAVCSLEPLLKQLKAMDLDSTFHSTESIKDDKKAIKIISVWLRNAAPEGNFDTDQLTFKDALKSIKKSINAVPCVEKEVEMALIENFKFFADNIIANVQANSTPL